MNADVRLNYLPGECAACLSYQLMSERLLILVNINDGLINRGCRIWTYFEEEQLIALHACTWRLIFVGLFQFTGLGDADVASSSVDLRLCVDASSVVGGIVAIIVDAADGRRGFAQRWRDSAAPGPVYGLLQRQGAAATLISVGEFSCLELLFVCVFCPPEFASVVIVVNSSFSFVADVN